MLMIRLEYDTVKVILTKEIEESISYNIFYTAITRAKKKLIIYCDNSSLEKIIHSFKRTDLSEDLKILKKKL